MLSRMQSMSLNDHFVDTVDSARCSREGFATRKFAETDEPRRVSFAPECIIFVIDAVACKKRLYMENDCQQLVKILPSIKMAIENYVTLKLAMNDKHIFSIVVLEGEKARMECPPTNDIRRFFLQLRMIKEENNDESNKIYSMRPAMEIIQEIIRRLDYNYQQSARGIFFYSRFSRVPEMNRLGSREVDIMCKDVVVLCGYIDEDDDEKVKQLETIYKRFLKWTKNSGFAVPIMGSFESFMELNVKLLAHPQQRVQSLFEENLNINEVFLQKQMKR